MNIIFDTYERCLNELKQCDSILDFCQQKLKHMPRGYLDVHKRKGGFHYYHVTAKKRTYLNKSRLKLRNALATKRYLLHCQRFVKMQKKSIEAYISKFDTSIEYPGIFLANHPELSNIVMGNSFQGSKELQVWMNLPYDQKTLEIKAENIRCAAGHFVRSKSECLIADALFSQGIPYRYEEPLDINGFHFLPDFTVFNVRTGKKYIWEHLGMGDKEDYIQKAKYKLSAYLENGYFPGVNLILTGSDNSTSFDSHLVRKTIEGYLL